MRKLITLLIASAAVTLAGSIIGGSSRAAMLDAPIALRAAANELTAIETVQVPLAGSALLLVRRRLAGRGVVLVRLSVAPGLRLGRACRMAWLAQASGSH